MEKCKFIAKKILEKCTNNKILSLEKCILYKIKHTT